jgi:hypothetical protein
MIGAALVFDDLAMPGLPRVRGILALVDANASKNSHTRDAHEASVHSGCLRNTLDFSKIFYFAVYYARN